MDDGQQVLSLPLNDTPLAIAFAPDSKTLAAGGSAGTITLWRAK